MRPSRADPRPSAAALALHPAGRARLPLPAALAAAVLAVVAAPAAAREPDARTYASTDRR